MIDVVVIGGSAAGLSAALTLGRSRRSVLVIDSGRPRNAPAHAVHGFLSREGLRPSQLLALGRDEVRMYGAQVVEAEVTAARRAEAGFVVALDDARTVRARRLLLATGLVDELPDTAGVEERWTRDVLHCPYCHGFEVRDRALGVLGSDARAVHQALLLGQWSAEVTLFRHQAPEPTDAEWEQLAARGVSVVEGEVERLEVQDDRLTSVRLRGGVSVRCEALFVSPRFAARTELAAGLGLTVTDTPVGNFVATEDGGHAGPGVWVAGNVANPVGQVVQSAAEGARAAMAINADLVAEDMARLVDHRRAATAVRAGGPAIP